MCAQHNEDWLRTLRKLTRPRKKCVRWGVLCTHPVAYWGIAVLFKRKHKNNSHSHSLVTIFDLSMNDHAIGDLPNERLAIEVLAIGVHVFVRGLCIATVQYFSFCGCALGWVLGGFDHMEVEVQDREHVEVRERERERRGMRDRKKTKQGNNKRSDRWWHVDETLFCADTSCDTLSHNVV